MAASRPTNSDIVKLLTINHEETSKRLEAVEEQVKYTNGQVRTLNDFKNRVETIEQFKKDNGEHAIDWQKILLVALGLLGTALTIIATTTGAK